MAAGDHRRARALLPAAALSADDLSHYLSAALAEDLSIDPLDVLNAALSEAATQAEWQPYLAAVSALIIDQRSRRDIADATRFRGDPIPLTIPALIQYEDLYRRPEPHYAKARATLVQRD